MRKTCRSSITSRTVRFSARAEARSRPKGFSMTTLVKRGSETDRMSPCLCSCRKSTGKVLGGVAK